MTGVEGYVESAAIGLLAGRFAASERFGIDLPAPPPDQLIRMSRLPMLTPGDFAAVIRQHRFRALTSSAALITALDGECALKPGAKRAIGFY